MQVCWRSAKTQEAIGIQELKRKNMEKAETHLLMAQVNRTRSEQH